ncbi:MAG: ATP-binding protein [Clostridia bacterium]|nr:ATP-binding protein [Clostridia bacterium]
MLDFNNKTLNELKRIDDNNRLAFNLTRDKLLETDEKFNSLYCEKNRNISLFLKTGDEKYNEKIQSIIKDIEDYCAFKHYENTTSSYVPKCNKCNDLGIKEADGKYCECFYKMRKQLILDTFPMLNVTPLSKVDTSIYEKSDEANNKKIIKVLNLLLTTDKYSVITIFGKPGIGKSYLAYASGNEYLNYGTVSVVPAIDTTSLFKFDFKTNRISGEDDLYEPDLLIIDDLGSEHYFDNINDTGLLQLLEIRQNKKTIITTNLNAKQLEARYHQRVMSRLTSKSNILINMPGEKDLRRK